MNFIDTDGKVWYLFYTEFVAEECNKDYYRLNVCYIFCFLNDLLHQFLLACGLQNNHGKLLLLGKSILKRREGDLKSSPSYIMLSMLEAHIQVP